jgi:hypothetical protein
MGYAADVRARQRGREPRGIRTAGADPLRDRLLQQRDRDRLVYTMGLPVFRTLAFTVGFIAQVVLALGIFRLV